jgi:hypothetical protein
MKSVYLYTNLYQQNIIYKSNIVNDLVFYHNLVLSS